MKKLMKNRKGESGQAIMELMVIMLAFVACMVGVFVVIALSLGNIDILMCSKTDAEMRAHDKVSGNSGSEIRRWFYTQYGEEGDYVEIPFSIHDEKKKTFADLGEMYSNLNSEKYSDAGNENYVYNDFLIFKGILPLNFADTEMYIDGYRAANLHKGRCGGYTGHNLLGCSCQKYFNSFSSLFGGVIDPEKLSESVGNEVYIPAMRLSLSN